MPTDAKLNPWAPELLHTDRTDYFPTPGEKAPKAILLQGSENWLGRFSTAIDLGSEGQPVKEEVQALFARWLRMQNLCVLMGAGASLYATKILNAKLLEHSAELLKGRRTIIALETIRAFASDKSGPDRKIEDFLSQLQGLCSLFGVNNGPLDKLPAPPLLSTAGGADDFTSIGALLSDLERAIAVVCNVKLPPSSLFPGSDGVCPETVTPHENLFAKLMARDPQDGRAKVFTSNYDTLIEQAMDRLGILYCDGFTGTVRRRFNAAAYDLDYYFPGEVGEGRVRRYHKVVQLYKLHGSINWRRCPLGGALNPYGIRYESGPIPTVDDIKGKKTTLDGVFLDGEGLGILPTANKYGQSLTMPFAHMFRSLGNALLQPQTVLFVIGYGGGDDHINQLIHDALVNPGFTCVVVDPYPSEWAKRLLRADYCQRVYCAAGAWGFFNIFAEHLLPNLETLKTEIDIARTLRELRAAIQTPPVVPFAPSDDPGSPKNA
jgi:hypothetical protein